MITPQHTACRCAQVIANDSCVVISVRPSYGKFYRYRIGMDTMRVDYLDVTEFLKFKERHAGRSMACTS
jgi:hypothetical protein